MKQNIQAKNLVYRYGSLKAVNDISFEVRKGEILGFLGPNGAGKSTTIKILTGQIPPDSGEARILGMDVTKNQINIKKSIGVCFERTNLYKEMSAKENLVFFASLFGIKRFDPSYLLDRVGLGDRMNEKVRKYSKGMKQRLMLARALVNRPQVLFLDEPTDGLDPVSAEAIRNLILEEKKHGVTVFLTTHDMMEADKLSDRVAFINKGRIEAPDTPYNLKLKYGKRILSVDLQSDAGGKETVEMPLDDKDAGAVLKRIFEQRTVLTLHSKEATLEDIFIKITGRGLTG